MSDFNSSLPVRTEAAGDVIAKIADKTVPSQQLKVNADGSIDTNISATDLDIRDLTSATDSVEAKQATHDNLNANANLQVGDADVANGNPVPISDAGGSVTVDATDLDIRNLLHSQDSVKVGDGTDFLAVNADGSINVKLSDASPGTPLAIYNTAAAVAAGATSNHDYTTTGTFNLTLVEASASSKMKIEIQVEDGVGAGTYTSKAVMFNSTANPNMSLKLGDPIPVASGVKVRIIRTNKDNQAQDLYSTVFGYNE